MKALSFALLAALAVMSVEQKSHAYGMCVRNDGSYYAGCPESHAFYLTSTTFTGPFGLIMDGQIDLSNPEVRALLLSQAEQVMNGQEDSINESENLVRVLAKANNVSDENLAQAVKSLEASGSEITDETIRKALK